MRSTLVAGENGVFDVGTGDRQHLRLDERVVSPPYDASACV
jgi:hypothetical protein